MLGSRCRPRKRRRGAPAEIDLFAHLALDPVAESTDPEVPAFMAPPGDAPPYHGFRVLDDVTVGGFTLGAINDFEAFPAEQGDGFVVAPDGSRAGMEWRTGKEPYVLVLADPRPDRWGVFAAGLPGPMRTREEARANLEAIVPLLREHWERWKLTYNVERTT